MTDPEPHGRSCAGCQILTLRTAIAYALEEGTIDDTTRRILLDSIGMNP
ncbi:hypothetical protein SEA_VALENTINIPUFF_31 [Microbacterium phage ValentiniPuff]|uniref:Uncharacterized protein n=1 Tax=Microbacterium phage ValentiniPuff TaxID=2315705 RepID=A0A386KRX4_9CAUD|nr:hypothetical protein SEA_VALENTINIPUFF_31 [Microbacterium phage ValentiniPuff]